MWYTTLLDYAEEHLWVPVVAGSALVLIVLFILWQCGCCCFARRKRTKYSKLLDGGAVEAGVAVNYGTAGPTNDLGVADVTRGRGTEDSERQAMSMRAQYFLRANRQFKLLQHLTQIGTRPGKGWFVIKPAAAADAIMAMYPATERTLLPLNPSIRQAMRDMLTLLQHPYIMAVQHLDVLPEQNQLVVMSTLAVKGSARDLLHGSNPIADIERKYPLRKAKQMPLKRIALLGRHVLEALAFLKKRKFAYRHLHAGNVILDASGTFKITGLEQLYFGYTHRDDKLVTKGLEKIGGDSASPWEYDVVCFGRMLFELACGYELRSSVPDVEQLVGKCEFQVIEIFVLIFFHPDSRVPSVEELLEQPLFQSARAAELDRYLATPMMLTDEIKSILKAGRKLKSTVRKQVRRGSAAGRSRRRSSASSLTTENPMYSPGGQPPASPAAAAAPPPPPPASTAAVPPPPPPPTIVAAPPLPPPSEAAGAAPPAAAAPEPGRGALLASIRSGTGLRKT
eukprot:CAMPEP_0206312538 /NCGR_PEP_ID=MMETSP0106_2-20121207/14043_1 /ASSEMBLY_ACC=CAM_ASM_000206 /TAXON_ID=81532 /ORGANISM="Acanthoeca-like sp., Strain 10tr" /LENGTH=508 /DNA_ID=CAMNT_0053743845 /DNA_START=112 /DNA_END=1634 /DNA_ORIENTATION=-